MNIHCRFLTAFNFSRSRFLRRLFLFLLVTGSHNYQQQSIVDSNSMSRHWKEQKRNRTFHHSFVFACVCAAKCVNRNTNTDTYSMHGTLKRNNKPNTSKTECLCVEGDRTANKQNACVLVVFSCDRTRFLFRTHDNSHQHAPDTHFQYCSLWHDRCQLFHLFKFMCAWYANILFRSI